MAGTRRKLSSVDRLDPQIKDLIGKLRIDHGWTIDEIRKKLLELGNGAEKISRSALGRHIASIEEIGARIRESRDLALALRSAIGEEEEHRTADLNVELLQTSIMRLLVRARDEDDEENAGEVKALATALRDLSAAKKINTDMVLKVREAAMKEAAKKAGDAAKSQGLSADTVDFIRKAVLGSDA